MPPQPQTGLLTAMKAKLPHFEGTRDFLTLTEWLYEVKEIFELIIASGEHISEDYIVRYAVSLFKGEVDISASFAEDS